MSEKTDKFVEKITKEGGGNSDKCKVYAVIVLGILIVFSSFCGIYYFADVDGYIQDTKDIFNLYDFYDEKVGENETAVFFFGSSIIGFSVYPPEINEILNENGYNVTAYNLVISDDIPIERTLEIQKIIDSKPSLVIFGLTYRSITYNPIRSVYRNSRFSERVNLVHSRLDVRENTYYLFTNEELKKITTEPSLSYKKTFLISALRENLFGKDEYAATLNYKIDPYGDKKRIYLSSKKNYSEIVEQSNDPTDEWRPIVTNESTRYKEALIYNVKTLQDAGIPVIIINMPLHPLFSEKITDESRQNFFDLLNQTGAVWYDMERDYGDEFFYDSHHASFYGAHQFAPVMANLIIEQVEKGVIHYS